ncbi:MAG: hypothetical protein U5J98_06970 [Halobacteriales archaeon]|nr:hypothetical protein [Halobacteriales archaeon]
MSSSSGEQLDPDSARKKAVNGVKKAFKPEPSQQTNSVLASLRQRAVQMLLVVGVMVALSWALGSLITVRTGAILFAGLVILSLATDRLGEFSFTFTLSAVALGGLIIAFALPAFVTDAFSSIIPTINALTGLQVQRIDPVRFALLSGAHPGGDVRRHPHRVGVSA